MNDIQKLALALVFGRGEECRFSSLSDDLSDMCNVSKRTAVLTLRKMCKDELFYSYYDHPEWAGNEYVRLTKAGAEQHRKNMKGCEQHTLEDMDRAIVLNPGSSNEITLGDYIDHKIKEALRNVRLTMLMEKL